MRTFIDETKTIIDNEGIRVRGWALDSSVIKQVKISVDRKYQENAKRG